MLSFAERYFHKPLDEITYDDLVAFVQQRIEENQTLEYKSKGLLIGKDGRIVSPKPPKPKEGWMGLATTVAGFANAEGGLLILGVAERKTRDQKGNIIQVHPGSLSPLPVSITREEIENHLTRLIQYPIDRLAIRAIRQSTESKGVFYLIDIPQSARAPHRVNEQWY